MNEPRTRGFCGLGAEGISKAANFGALLRTAHAFGAAFAFSVGAGWDSRDSRRADTADTPAHLPVYRWDSPGAMVLPDRCALVGVEIADDAVDLPSFRHPLSAAYVLGAERGGLTKAMQARCDHLIRIPTRFSLNLAVAGALVLYDRLIQHGRFAERPVASGGPGAEAAAATAGHGRPVFRKEVPDWARE